jgi:hypothetical protein
MTLQEIDEQLAGLGFWERHPVPNPGGHSRLVALRALLVGLDRTWVQLGRRFKPAGLLTREDWTLLRDWADESRDALNDDLARILLGERDTARHGAEMQVVALKELVSQARSLVDELARLARQLERQADCGPSSAATVLPEARRCRAVAASLSEQLRGRCW